MRDEGNEWLRKILKGFLIVRMRNVGAVILPIATLS